MLFPTSYAHMNSLLFLQAEIYDVSDRVAMHARLTEGDYAVVRASGASTLHVYGNGLKLIGNRYIGIDDWLNRVDKLADRGYQDGLLGMRASMEQATQMNHDDLRIFIKGLGLIQHTPGRVLTGIGLPDTNGRSEPQQWQDMFRTCGKDIAATGLTLFIHLHNDGEQAGENAQTILDLAPRYGISTVLEASLDRYWGERGPGGLHPHIGQLPTMGHTQPLPDVQFLVTGSSWMDGDEETRQVREDIARRTDTAGVHTRHAHHYGNGNDEPRIVAAGMYAGMGQGNIDAAHGTIFPARAEPLDRSLTKDAALVAREIAARRHLPQAYALAFARLVEEDPAHVRDTARSFGDPLTWARNPLPDIRPTMDRLEAMKDEMFPG